MSLRRRQEYDDFIDREIDAISRNSEDKPTIHVQGATAQVGKYNNDAYNGSQTNIEINININVSENTSPKALQDLEHILQKIKEIRGNG